MYKFPIIKTVQTLTLVVLCLLLSVGQAFAQAQAGTGQITGVVTDAAGAVVPNATVTATNNATNQTQTVNTGDDGTYRFVALQPATYSVNVSAGTFAPQTLDVEVQVGRATDANITLGTSNVAAEVTVTAEGVQTTQIQSDAVINAAQIENLPINGRRFQDFAVLTPTVQIDPDRGQLSIAGQRGINSNVSVDGTDYNQPFFGGIRGGERSNFGFTIPQEAIREFQVVAGGYSPEFGRSSGGVVNVVTKSGGNDFRGSAFYLLRPEQLSRNSAFVNEVERQFNAGLSAERDPVDFQAAPTQQQFGGSFGGPIVKDRLFFFAAYEQQIFRADRQAVFTGLDVISANATNQDAINFFRGQESAFQITNDSNAILGRVDWNVNDNNRFNARYNFSRNIGENFITTGSSLGLISPFVAGSLSNEGTERDRINAFVAQLNSNFGASAVNEFRFQYSREDRPRIANALAPRINVGNVGELGTRSFFPSEQYDTRLQFTDSFTYVVENHTLKFGGEFSRLYANQLFGFNQFGAYTFAVNGNAGLQELTGAVATPALPTTPSSVTFRRFGRFDGLTVTRAANGNFSAAPQTFFAQQVGNLEAAFPVYEAAAFAQDSWRIRPNFTLDYGLRVDRQFNPTPELGNTTLINAVQNTRFPLLNGQGFDPSQIPDSELQFGPRVGFAWDIENNGKSVLRGFGGIFYARTPLLIFAGGVNNFRTTPGDVSINLGTGITPGNLNVFPGQTASAAQLAALQTFVNNNPNYVTALNANGVNCAAVTAANAPFCSPNTIYRQFLLAGINLNTTNLSDLPTLTSDQINRIGTAFGLTNVLTGNGQPGIPLGADLQGVAPDFQNPRAVQFGLAFEREVARSFVVGVDYLQVNTDFLQRNRDINLFPPTPIGPVQRPTFSAANSARPFGVSNPGLPTIRRLFLRESTARSRYNAVTLRARLNRRFATLSAFYTFSRNNSDDDNERNATGLFYENTYNLRPEFNRSDLDRTHQFVANPVFFLPYGVEVSSAVRLRSGRPITAVVGSDLNADTNNNDRPFFVPGVSFERNQFRNRNIYEVDLRAQKGFRFDEARRIVFSAEFFNLLNSSNIQIAGPQNQYCLTTNDATCGLNGATNPNFLQIREQRIGNPNFGQFITSNSLGSGVFQVQLGARFQF